MLFSVNRQVPDAAFRRFELDPESNWKDILSVDGANGNVYLHSTRGKLDYENEEMRQLVIIIDAIKRSNPSGR